jgi:23S rRNA (cytidine1920-2'-O)/16S rRNA (cytidine1409-2'-O)-methyltransferase
MSTSKTRKTRLDRLCVARGLAPTRQRAQALILAGKVLVNDQVMTKAGTLVPEGANVRLKAADHPYVSRGGLKLEAALRTFALQVAGCVALDVGASTGGFTDCLLQHGARHVIAVDVGYGQLDWKLRQDGRVTCIERCNARTLETAGLRQAVDNPELWPVELCTIDVSFISLTLVLPAVSRMLGPERPIVALVKPQFEAERAHVGKGGVVRDPEKRKLAIDRVLCWAREHGYRIEGSIESPITGPKGNLEQLVLLRAILDGWA